MIFRVGLRFLFIFTGGLEYKASIADTIIIIIEENPEAKEIGLAHLCEFIEDCEHFSLAVRILHLLGKEGPRTKTPSRYIRFIYNRVILECASVRAAAVASLAQFGAACPDLRHNICVLLSRCQMDTDNEVRDRATYYTSILKSGDKQLINDYIIDSPQVCTIFFFLYALAKIFNLEILIFLRCQYQL